MNKKIRNDLILLVGVIIFCGLGARFIMKGETLEEYAKNNPQTSIASENASSSSKYDNDDSDPVSSSDAKANASDSMSTDESIAISASSADTTAVSATESVTNQGSMRVIFSEGFYYEPIPEDVFARIDGVSFKENDNISLDELSYCVLLYNDFNGETRNGEMICNTAIADDVMEIFHELYVSGYQIESIRLVDEFGGDDTASMLANNTSCFNYRVVDNTSRLSNHAYGLAIDINPFYNPYITYGKDGTVRISPEGSEAYADRTSSFPYKIDENDLAYKLFKAHGFKWGGDWNSVKDYQHFEKKG